MLLYKKDGTAADPRLQNALVASEMWISRGLNSTPIQVRRQIISDAFAAADAAKSRRAKWVAESVAWTAATIGEIHMTTDTWVAKNLQNSLSFQRWAKGIVARA